MIKTQYQEDGVSISFEQADGTCGTFSVNTARFDSYKQEAEDAGLWPPLAYVAPEPTWLDKRLAKIADGGYGTIPEQMEMIGEQGIGVFQTHVQTVKTNNPKLV